MELQIKGKENDSVEVTDESVEFGMGLLVGFVISLVVNALVITSFFKYLCN